MQHMSKHHITLKDIALSTGFSINTISHALNDKEDISQATKELVRQKAEELGYIRNAAAGSLRLNRTKTIAVIIGDISNPFFGILVREIEIFARQHEYLTLIINTEEDAALELRAVKSALEKKVDGIILCSNQKSDAAVNLLEKLAFPFVLAGRFFEGRDFDHVVADDRKGGYLATHYLIGRQNQRILFLNGPGYISSARFRLQGYQSALAEAGLPFDPDLVKEISVTGNVAALLRQIISQALDFTAILAFSDLLAWEIIDITRRPEFSSLKNIEVVGFDNIQSNMMIPYPLTSINYDKLLMAHRAVEILLSRINRLTEESPVQIALDTELVVR